jgi:hypothetical protein
MPNRTQIKAKLLISKDNSANPTRVSYNSGDVEVVNTTAYSEDSSAFLKLAPSAADVQVRLGSLSKAEVLMVIPRADGVSVKIVCTGQILADALPIPLKKDHPFIVCSDVIEVYLSNSSTTDSADVEVGASGN